MASAKGIRAGAAYVELYAEDNRLARGLHLAQRRLKAFSVSVRHLGAGFLKVGAAVAAPVVAGTKVYADFEQQMANVATMLDDPGQYMDEFRRGIRRMAMEFGESTETLAGGLYDILSASVPAEHALDVLAVSARAARAGLTDTAIAADAITTMLNAYGLSADKATNISDLLFTVVKRGKCVTGNTRVLLSDGGYVPIENLRGVVDVISWDGRNFTQASGHWVEMGEKETLRVRTSFGREIVTTPEHPYLTLTGWKPVDELNVGEKIALPVSLPFFGDVKPQKGWPTLLGYLISEGSIKSTSPRVTAARQTVIQDIHKAGSDYGVEVTEVHIKDPSKCPMFGLVAGRRGLVKSNPVIEKLREYGLWGKHSRDKFIPDECFRWRKDDIIDLLRALFNGDGWLCPLLSGFQLGYCSTSRRLVSDISHLLLRLGIVMRITKMNGNNAFFLETRRYVDIKRFLDFVGIDRPSVSDFRNYLPGGTEDLRLHRRSNLTSFREGVPSQPKRFKPYSWVRDFDQPIFFDKIVSIEPAGLQRVYDLTVPAMQNFVANDIVAHNTTFAELAPGIGNVANIASTAGLSLEEMGATIALLTRNGIKTEEAITALRAVLTAFLKPSAEGADLARELGFEMNVATLKAEGLAGIFARIGKLPPEAIATLFPNVRALKGVLPALQSLKGFGEDIEAMRKRAGSTETAYAKMTGTLAHSFAQVKQSAVAVLAVIGEALSKPMERAAGVLKRYLGLLTDWLAKNKELVVAAVKVGAVIGLIGAALVTLGTAGLALSFVFGGIASIVSLVGALFAGLGAVLGTLLSPIGLIVAGMGVLSVAVLKASGLGAKAVSWLGEQFAVLEADVREAWKGIGDALAAGDLGLAARILWLTLKMEWERGIHELHRAWIGFKAAFQSVITGAFYGVQVYLVDAWAGLRAGWVDTVSFLGQVWAGFIAGLQRGWNTAGGFIQKRFLEIMGLFDSELDVGLAKRITDEKIADLDRTLVAGLAGVLQESDAEREAKKVAIRRDRDRAVTEIAAEADREDHVRRRAYEEDLKGSEAALARARQEWREAIAAAGQKRPATEGGEEAPAISTELDVTTAKGVHRSFEALQDQLGRVSGAIDDTLARTTRIDTVGTFNAAAAAGLGSSNAADRTAKATEETARNTKRLVTEFSGDGEMEFA